MKVALIILSVVLYAHVARGGVSRGSSHSDEKTGNDKKQAAQSNAVQAEITETCTAQGKTFQTGDRYCSDDKTHRVCSFGTWIDNPCPEGFTCVQPDPDTYKVACRQINRNPPYQTAPPDAVATNPDLNREIKLSAQPAGQPHGQANTQSRRKRDADKHEAKSDDAAKSNANADQPQAAPAAPSDSCSADGKTLQTGDRYCKDQKTHSVCSYGTVYDNACPDGFDCVQTSPNTVACRQYNRNGPYPTAPPDAVAQNADLNKEYKLSAQPVGQSNGQANSQSRRKRDAEKHEAKSDDAAKPNADQPQAAPAAQPQAAPADKAAPAAPAQSDSCSADGKTLQTGDRYCKDEKTHGVCSYGTVYENPCPDGYKCVQSGNAVACRQINRNGPYPTAPPDAVAQNADLNKEYKLTAQSIRTVNSDGSITES